MYTVRTGPARGLGRIQQRRSRTPFYWETTLSNTTPPTPEQPNVPVPAQQPYAQAPQQPYAQVPPQPYAQAPQPYGQAPQQPYAPVATKPARNVVGIVGLSIAAAGFLFACIPGILILGWILLPIGFIVGLVSLFLSGKAKWPGLVALIVAVVGTVVGFVVFFALAAGAVNDAFDSSGDVTVGASTEAPADTDEGDDAPAAAEGTRENPVAFGTPISNNDWDIKLNSLDVNGNAAVAAANQFNEAPAEGKQYIILDMSATYKGSGDGTSMMVQVEYVAADGTVISTWDNFVSGIDPTFGQASLLAGATDTGKQVFLVPSTLDGLIRVTPGVLADEVYFKLQ